MRINTRFPVAVHILAVAAFCKENPATSDFAAKSINTNPVVVRRITAMLKKAGIADVRPGVGGIILQREPAAITLLDIYKAVKEPEREELFDLHQNMNPRCPVGANIHEALAEPLGYAQKQMEDGLAEYTLFDVMKKIADNSRLSLD